MSRRIAVRLATVAVIGFVRASESPANAQVPDPLPQQPSPRTVIEGSGTPSPPPAPTPARFSRTQAVTYGLVSAMLGAASFGIVDRLPARAIGGQTSYYRYGTALAASLPLAAVSPIDGLQIGGAQIGLTADVVALRHAVTLNAAYGPYWVTAEEIVAHQGLYAAYATYRAAREKGASDTWNDAWRPWTASELVLAPFHPKNLRRAIVLASTATVVAASGLEIASYFANGNALPGNVGVNFALALPLAFDAGVTEEAIFRGFFYEELKLSIGRWPARAIDSSLFSAFHVPGEIGVESTSEIVSGLVARAVIGLFLELAYDDGGLPESVSLHVLWDVVALSTAALTKSNLLGGDLAVPTRRVRSDTPVIVPVMSGVF